LLSDGDVSSAISLLRFPTRSSRLRAVMQHSVPAAGNSLCELTQRDGANPRCQAEPEVEKSFSFSNSRPGVLGPKMTL